MITDRISRLARRLMRETGWKGMVKAGRAVLENVRTRRWLDAREWGRERDREYERENS